MNAYVNGSTLIGPGRYSTLRSGILEYAGNPVEHAGTLILPGNSHVIHNSIIAIPVLASEIFVV